MTSQEKILTLMRNAFLEIRHQARSEDCEIKSIELLSDLFHNVPSALLNHDLNDDDLLQQIIERSEAHKGLNEWVLNSLK